MNHEDDIDEIRKGSPPMFLQNESKVSMLVDPDHYRNIIDKHLALTEKYSDLADKYIDLLLRNKGD
jgi:hypothetical protein